MKDLAHDGNFTLPSNIPAVPATAEAGQHWRIGVDPAAKGALRHDDDDNGEMASGRKGGSSDGSFTDGSEADADTDELWDEVASMVGCPTPKQSDYYFSAGAEREEEKGEIKRAGGSKVSYRTLGSRSLQRSMTRKTSVMSAASTASWTSRYSCATDGRRYDDDGYGYDESEG